LPAHPNVYNKNDKTDNAFGIEGYKNFAAHLKKIASTKVYRATPLILFTSFYNHPYSLLGPRQTRHFCTQYCYKKYCGKKLF